MNDKQTLNRQSRQIIIALTIVILVLLVVTIFAILQWQEEERQNKTVMISGTGSEPTCAVSSSPAPTQYSTSLPTSLTPTLLANDSILVPYKIEDPIVAEVIQLALNDRKKVAPHGGETFCSYELLMPLQTDIEGRIKAYLHTFCVEYYENCGVLLSGTASSGPIALTLEQLEEGWYVELQQPDAGNQYWSSINEIFPSQALSRILDPTYHTADGMVFGQDSILQAEDYFGLPVQPLLTAAPTKTPRPTSSVRIIPLTPTPTLPAIDILTRNLEVTMADISSYSHEGDYLSVSARLGGGFYHWRLSSFQKGQLTYGWHVDLYQRRADGDYADQDVLILDDVRESTGYNYTFFVKAEIEEIRDQLSDHRDLFYQIVDGTGKVVWQGEFYDSLGLSHPPLDHYADAADGVVVGYPKLVSEDLTIFKPEGKFIPIDEVPGGFDHLHYEFDFWKESGTTMTSFDLMDLMEELEIRVFPYREDGEYKIENSFAFTGRTLGGGGPFFRVHFPYDWLSGAFQDEQMYYLRIADGEGNIYLEEYFHFIPSAP